MQLTEEHERNIIEILLDAPDPAEGLSAAAMLLCIYDLADDESQMTPLRSERRFVRELRRRWPNLIERVHAIALRRLQNEDAMEPGSLAQTVQAARARAAGA